MSLETFDPVRQKYILYRTQHQHTADCARFPFESIPRRIFLDTNVINILVKYCDYIFDHVPIPAGMEQTRAFDVEALRHIFSVGQRAGWDILASPKVLEEIRNTPNAVLRSELLSYALGIVNQNIEDRESALNIEPKPTDTGSVESLPDRADRELVDNAMRLGCDVFCTCDRATIIRKRDGVEQLNLRILTPAEWWAHIKPWAALWC